MAIQMAKKYHMKTFTPPPSAIRKSVMRIKDKKFILIDKALFKYPAYTSEF
jgi:hypothetical protein